MSATEATAFDLGQHGSLEDDLGIRRTIPARRPQLTIVGPPALRSRCVGWRWHAKRCFDVTVVVLLLPFVLPVMAVIAVVTKCSSPGPILFRQARVGHEGRTFPMLKFRTMYTDSTERLRADIALYDRYVRNDFKLPAHEDPRLVPGGRLLRSTSLDELPQLFNVLLGHMSLVGPWPVVEEELRAHGSMVAAYVYVRPGVTGRWQTEGRNDVRYPERARLDAEYVERFRLRSDIWILCKTVPCVMRRTGVH